jgi:Ca-activated chloride channel family protein
MNTPLKCFAIGLLGLLISGPGVAGDTGTIQGRITGQGQGLYGLAQVQPTGAQAASGADGRFALAVKAGTYTLTCSAPGWRVRTVPGVQVTAGASVTINCPLQHLAPETQTPVVAQTRGTKSAPASRAVATASSAARPAAEPAPVRVRKPRPSRRPAAKARRRASEHVMFDAMRAAPPMQPMARPAPPPPANREGYAHIAESGFKSAKDSPLSTFSIDVDTASYANVRRMLTADQLPPAGAVRIEELINYFTYDYPQPEGEHPFAVQTEISQAPWNPAHKLVHIGLQGQTVDASALPPANLVFLLDVSGSMNQPAKLPLLKKAFKLLVNQLRPQDSVSIVVYAGAAGLVLPPTSGADRPRIVAALDTLRAGGSTAGGAGIQLAYEVARKQFVKGGNNRVILATDGDFNVGVSSRGGLVKLIEAKRDQGIFLTVLGFGTGNYQDAKMEQLANKGNGNAAYIDSLLEAKKVLVTEMGGTLLTIAKDVKIQVEFNPAKVHSYRLVGYENRALANEDFNNDKKDAGELGAGHTVTVLYEIVPVGAEGTASVDPLKYQATPLKQAAFGDELMTLKLRYKQPQGSTSQLITHALLDHATPLAKTSANFRFSAAVATFGMRLRDSQHQGGATWNQLIELARGARGTDHHGYRAEFVRLAEKAQLLAQLRAQSQPGPAKTQVIQVAR